MIHTALELHLQENQEVLHSRLALKSLILLVSRYSRLHRAFLWAQIVLDGPAEPQRRCGQCDILQQTCMIFSRNVELTYRNPIISRKPRNTSHSLWN